MVKSSQRVKGFRESLLCIRSDFKQAKSKEIHNINDQSKPWG